MMSDEEFYGRVLQNMFDIFIEPEVKRRHQAGLIPSLPMALSAAQIIFSSTDGPPVVRLNQEVKAAGTFTVSPEKAAPGTQINLEDIVAMGTIFPSDPEDQNAGHMTAVWFAGTCLLAFDFRYNKPLAGRHVASARDYLEVARNAKDVTKSWPVFVENLFSAMELAVKAFLWTTPWGKELKARMPHTQIRSAFAKYPIGLNEMQSKADTLELLARERNAARYLHADIDPKWSDGEEWFRDTEEMLERAEAQVSSRLPEGANPRDSAESGSSIQ